MSENISVSFLKNGSNKTTQGEKAEETKVEAVQQTQPLVQKRQEQATPSKKIIPTEQPARVQQPVRVQQAVQQPQVVEEDDEIIEEPDEVLENSYDDIEYDDGYYDYLKGRIATPIEKEDKNKDHNDYLPARFDSMPTKLRQIARPDLPLSFYAVKDKATNFKMYNAELGRRLSSFSSDNQDYFGGEAITKAQVIEACLDFVFYDMKLKPQGFKSTEEIREFLREQLK